MSLSISHGIYDGTCSNFNKVRNKIAQLAGFNNMHSVYLNHKLHPLMTCSDQEDELELLEAFSILEGLQPVYSKLISEYDSSCSESEQEDFDYFDYKIRTMINGFQKAIIAKELITLR